MINIRKRLQPGTILYHRPNYIHDKVNALGEVKVIQVADEIIVVETVRGIKRFNFSALGNFLFFEESAVTQIERLDGELHLSDEEGKLYIRSNEDRIYSQENIIFTKIVEKIEMLKEAVSGSISIKKFGFNDSQDQFDRSLNSDLSDLRDTEQHYRDVLAQPYFAKLELGKHSKPYLYIGNKSVPEAPEPIIDWRDPVSQLYFTTNPVLYRKYELELIRKFDIFDGSFCGYYDSYTSQEETASENRVIDDFFLSVIENNRKNNKLQEIVQTLQEKQYQIISLPSENNILVQGCAGSGKTMILMHRISFLLFNDNTFNKDNVVIITPNKQLNLELNELAKKLDLGRISRFTLPEYYLYMILKYFDSHKISNKINYYKNLSDACADNKSEIKLLSPKLEAMAYSSSLVKTFRSYFEVFAEYESIFTFSNLFAIEDLSFQSRLEFISDFESKTSYLRNIFEYTHKEFEFDTVPNIEREKKKIIRELNADTMSFHSLLNKHELLSNSSRMDIEGIQNFRIPPNRYLDMHLDEIKKIQRKREDILDGHKSITKLERIEVEVRRYLEDHIFLRYPEITFGNLRLTRNTFTSQNLMHYLYEYFQVYKKVAHLRKYLKRENNSYLIAAWQSFVAEWKKSNALDVHACYEFEYFALLSMLHDQYGKLSNGRQWLFVDEGQDYSFVSMELAAGIHEQATINIFGDIRQQIVPMNMANYFEHCLTNPDFFINEIETNYRNCVQVTEYVNEQCGMKMIPIGLQGSVTEYTPKTLPSVKWTQFTGRNVIIVKDQTTFERLTSLVPAHIRNLMTYNDLAFSEKTVNVMSVRQVKGLEFSQIFVYGRSMSQNELYVACTRALNSLCVTA